MSRGFLIVSLVAASLISQTVCAMSIVNNNNNLNSKPLPRLALPEPIRSETPGTWAYDTMSRRIDSEILERTYQDNKETFESAKFAGILARFKELRFELQHAASTKLSYLEDLPVTAASNAKQQKEHEEWQQLLKPHVEKQETWLSAPWMITEFYLYRRLLQALGYFSSKSPGYLYDPFRKSKKDGLSSSVGSAEPFLKRLPTLPKTKEGLLVATEIALWGNKMDLSLWPADASQGNLDIFTAILEQASDNFLANDGDLLASYCAKLQAQGGGNVDIVVDNAGFELVTDLALAQYLIESKIAKVVTFQLKSHPTFVSDAMERDLLDTVEHYASLDESQFPGARSAGETWTEFLKNGQWKCHQDPFWCQPFAMWDMTEPLRTDMHTRCELAFVKGDANYRRLLGDRMWDLSSPFEDVVGAYFPCPVCALRTLKAELGCGMEASQVERARQLDDQWMVNGRFGVLHFGKGAGR
jgi:hypothetical protein